MTLAQRVQAAQAQAAQRGTECKSAAGAKRPAAASKPGARVKKAKLLPPYPELLDDALDECPLLWRCLIQQTYVKYGPQPRKPRAAAKAAQTMTAASAAPGAAPHAGGPPAGPPPAEGAARAEQAAQRPKLCDTPARSLSASGAAAAPAVHAADHQEYSSELQQVHRSIVQDERWLNANLTVEDVAAAVQQPDALQALAQACLPPPAQSASQLERQARLPQHAAVQPAAGALQDAAAARPKDACLQHGSHHYAAATAEAPDEAQDAILSPARFGPEAQLPLTWEDHNAAARPQSAGFDAAPASCDAPQQQDDLNGPDADWPGDNACNDENACASQRELDMPFESQQLGEVKCDNNTAGDAAAGSAAASPMLHAKQAEEAACIQPPPAAAQHCSMLAALPVRTGSAAQGNSTAAATAAVRVPVRRCIVAKAARQSAEDDDDAPLVARNRAEPPRPAALAALQQPAMAPAQPRAASADAAQPERELAHAAGANACARTQELGSPGGLQFNSPEPPMSGGSPHANTTAEAGASVRAATPADESAPAPDADLQPLAARSPAQCAGGPGAVEQVPQIQWRSCSPAHDGPSRLPAEGLAAVPDVFQPLAEPRVVPETDTMHMPVALGTPGRAFPAADAHECIPDTPDDSQPGVAGTAASADQQCAQADAARAALPSTADAGASLAFSLCVASAPAAPPVASKPLATAEQGASAAALLATRVSSEQVQQPADAAAALPTTQPQDGWPAELHAAGDAWPSTRDTGRAAPQAADPAQRALRRASDHQAAAAVPVAAAGDIAHLFPAGGCGLCFSPLCVPHR